MYHFLAVTINSDRPEVAEVEDVDETERPGGESPDLSIDELVAAGRHAEAAARAREAGELAGAAALYERIWEFGQAAACAREAGDLPRALRNAVDARDEALVTELGQVMDAQGEASRRAAMEIFAGKRRFGDAAMRAEALGAHEQAAEWYRKAHRELDAARLLEQMGRDREAGRLLERLAELSAPGPEQAQARLRLGRLLLRRMQYEAAAQHLQDATAEEHTRPEARHSLILALAGMGLRDAARDVLVAARTDDPALPADLEAFLRAEREATPALPAAPADRGIQVVGGRYRLDRLLGAGSTGRVYRAHDEVGERTVAVKLFTLSRNHQAYERFVREAQVTGALRHANLVEVYDFSADQGYLVMEHMAGGSLAQRLQGQAPDDTGDGGDAGIRGPLRGPAVRRLALDVLDGLALAHQRGIIHRDIKPANIFFDVRGAAKLGDFGVAHLLDLGQTQTGGLIGTLAYMAPEQITGAPLTIAADLYALGVTLFEVLAGRLPFLGPDFVAQHLGEEPPVPSSVAGAAIAPGWDAVLARLLAKNPAERHESVDALRRDLVALDLGEGPRVLVLPRGRTERADAERANAGAGAEADLAGLLEPVPGREEGDTAAAESEEEAPRYRFETPIGRTEISHLGRAVDTILNRSVIIERFIEGGLDQATEQRLYALARGGSPFLQWTLAFDRNSGREAGVAVFEAPSGAPLVEVLTERTLAPRDAVRLLLRLARAVAPLHERGVAHGAISATTMLLDEQVNPTLLVCGLGRAPASGAAGAGDDVAAILDLVARLAGVAVPAAGTAAPVLIDALAPDLDADRRDALVRLAEPTDGEALYTFAEALEIAILAPGPGG